MKKTTRKKLIMLGAVGAFVAYAALPSLLGPFKLEPERNCFIGEKPVKCPSSITRVQDSIVCATTDKVLMKNGKKEATGTLLPQSKVTLNVERVCDDLMAVEITTPEGIKGYLKVFECTASANSN